MGTGDVNIKYIDLFNDRCYARKAIKGNWSPEARKSTDRTVITRKKQQYEADLPNIRQAAAEDRWGRYDKINGNYSRSSYVIVTCWRSLSESVKCLVRVEHVTQIPGRN
jgi:hypothetical protein